MTVAEFIEMLKMLDQNKLVFIVDDYGDDCSPQEIMVEHDTYISF